MKFVYKNILINTIISVCVLLIGESSLYFFLKYKMEKETVEHLYLERMYMMTQLKKGVNIDYFKHNIGDVLEINPIPVIQYKNPVINEITIEEEWEEEEFTSKKIIFDVTQNQKNYRVAITKTIDEDEGLMGSLSVIIFVSIFFMLFILVVVNVLVYNKLFSPIYQVIKDIKNFSVQQMQKIIPPKTNTYEFAILSEEISKMSEKMISDFTSVKEFTENITHEIQTPLAVINSKIERCLQDENLSNEQALLLSEASKYVNKLFNINKGLTLLSKLDNKQFNNPINIKLSVLIEQRLNYFSDFIENKNLSVVKDISEEIPVVMKESLSEILIDNILKNAIQHNIQNGQILITTNNGLFSVSNTGAVPKFATEKYFERFHSQNQNQSLGLGLSIVKKIVEYYDYIITYTYSNELHVVSIDFNKCAKTT